jgi:hypothetical protein
MTKNVSAGHAVTGWCDARHVHDGRYHHTWQPTCRNFVSDAEHTARLMTEAREHDRKVQHRYPDGATNLARAYVAEHRPY